ncbi:MAG: hypothetical protein H0Z35_13745 [Thermoanaerobacteraceae bacterium]|nr:hypothetical protein [Thermoanaerobacteraceae bacterium]
MKTYERFILSSTRPLFGQLRYRDVFQIHPLNYKKNDSPGEIRRIYDFILEISLEKGELYFRYSYPFGSMVPGKKVLEIVHLLSTISQFFIFNPRGPVCDELDGFTNNNYPQVKQGEIRYYQNRSVNDQTVEEIIFPKNAIEYLDFYFTLNSENKDIFRRSMFLFYSGVELEFTHRSLAYVSLISCIETLIAASLNKPSKKCKCCGQDILKISKKFKWFIKNFSGIDNISYINRLYSFRSKIVHGGYILISDKVWHDNYEDMIGGKGDDYFLRKNLIGIARACLLNWLRYVAKNNNNRSLNDLFENETE